MTEQEKAIIRQMATYIELGSQGKQQITGRFVDEEGICAMGACFIGAGITSMWIHDLRKLLGLSLLDEFPKVAYPENVEYWGWISTPDNVQIDDVIISLNDKAGWDFAHIVAWMRSIAE